MIKEIKIPDIAENVESGLIASILVSEGDKVSKDQALVEVETDKAATEIPSDYDGVVKEIKVSEGDEVKVNETIIILEVEDEKGGTDKEKSEKEEAKSDDSSKEEKTTDDTTDKKKEDQDSEKQEANKKKKSTSADKEKEQKDNGSENKPEGKGVPASPLARKIAREHDVDISQVEGSGPGNRISRADVEEYIESGKKSSGRDKSDGRPLKFDGSTTSEPLSTINKITAETMQEAWQTIPHVTQFDEADITKLEEFRKEHQGKVEKQGGKLTVTAILLKIVAFALQKYPRFNSSLDWDNKSLVYKHYFNVGIAVDTPQGLLVPVIKDVNQKSLSELSVELGELAKKAREKKINVDEMQDGNFTLSNLGGIGGTNFTPIVYPPQVAILGVSRTQSKQVLVNGEFEERMVIPLSLSYDHRVINGADGARFLRYICNVIEDPYALLF